MIAKKEKIKEEETEEKSWDNPADPVQASDERDVEQLKRQAKEAKRRRDNLSDKDNK